MKHLPWTKKAGNVSHQGLLLLKAVRSAAFKNNNPWSRTPPKSY
jgi:hypothetical protein